MPCLAWIIVSFAAAGTASAAPAMLRPEQAASQLQTDVTRAPHALALPPELDKPGAGYWGLFKICVSETGTVSSTETIKSTGNAPLDNAWSTTVRGWKYQPYTVEGATVPFCYAQRLQIGQAADPAAKKAVMIAPQVGAGALLTNVQKAPHKPTLPEHLNAARAALWGMYRVCVNAEGEVSAVSVVRTAGFSVLKPADQQLVDNRWMDVIKTWKYRPYKLDDKPVPFCYPLRLSVATRR